MNLKMLFKVLTIFKNIVGWIGTDKIYNWAKPLVEKEIRKVIDLPNDTTEKELEDIIIITTDLFIKFALGLPLDYEPKE